MAEEDSKPGTKTEIATGSRRRLLKGLAGGLAAAAAAVALPRIAEVARADQYQVIATVHNQTAFLLKLNDWSLPWGNWVILPQDVPAWTNVAFESTGRYVGFDQGTGGAVNWTLVGHPQSPAIRAGFSDPVSGSDRANITSTPSAVSVTATQSHGDVDYVDFYIG